MKLRENVLTRVAFACHQNELYHRNVIDQLFGCPLSDLLQIRNVKDGPPVESNSNNNIKLLLAKYIYIILVFA